MSQAQALLNALNDDTAFADVEYAEDRITVDTDRFIHVPDTMRRLGVQHDHNIETVTFVCPRFWDGIDMSEMCIYVNYLRPDGVKGRFLTTNLTVEDETMTFDWVISNNVTQVKGKLSFLICIVKTNEDGLKEQHWNSELNQECYISEGMECHDSIVLGYPDVITHILLQMDKNGSGSGTSASSEPDLVIGLNVVDPKNYKSPFGTTRYSAEDVSIVSGSVADVVAKIENNRPARVVLREMNFYSGQLWSRNVCEATNVSAVHYGENGYLNDPVVGMVCVFYTEPCPSIIVRGTRTLARYAISFEIPSGQINYVEFSKLTMNEE